MKITDKNTLLVQKYIEDNGLKISFDLPEYNSKVFPLRGKIFEDGVSIERIY